jgi:carbon monoxide dehydrogenase subunit G
VLVLTATLFALAAPGGLADAELEAVLRGDVPTRTESFTTGAGKAAGRGLGAIAIDRPLADVWSTLARFEDRAEYVPRLESAQVLGRDGDVVRVKMQVNASVATVRYTMRFTLDEPGHAIRWTLDPSAPDNGIRGAEGDYRLFALSPTRTLVIYRTWVDSGRSVPQFVQSYMSKRSIPELLRAVKKRVESGGTWKK